MKKQMLIALITVAGMVSPPLFAKTVKVEILGMVCALCSQGLTKGFSAKKSVESVNVNMEDQLVTLTLKEGQSLEDSEIKKVVEDAGVNVKQISR